MGGKAQPDRKGLLPSLWSGDVPLGPAFWWYSLILGSLGNLIGTAVSLVLVTYHQPAMALVAHFAPIPYNIFCLVAVWRSAGRYQGPPHWAQLARVFIAFWAVAASAF